MFVNFVQLPAIKAGKDAEFREWFAWSNEEFAKHKGFIGRRLLKTMDGDAYVAIVEHESYETFIAMHDGPTRAIVYERVAPLFVGRPISASYEVVLG